MSCSKISKNWIFIYLLSIFTTIRVTSAEHKCLCSSNVEQTVFSAANSSYKTLEVDCKPSHTKDTSPYSSKFYCIQFEQQVKWRYTRLWYICIWHKSGAHFCLLISQRRRSITAKVTASKLSIDSLRNCQQWT